MKRSENSMPALGAAVGGPGVLDGAFGGSEHDRIQAWVDGVDVLEVRAHDLDRGELLGCDGAGQPPGRGADYISQIGSGRRD